MAVCLSSLAWVEWDEPLQVTLNFPNKLSGWKGLGETLSLGYEFIPLDACGMGMLPGLTRRVISTAYPCLGWSITGSQSFQELSSALSVRWGEKTLSTVGRAVFQYLA